MSKSLPLPGEEIVALARVPKMSASRVVSVSRGFKSPPVTVGTALFSARIPKALAVVPPPTSQFHAAAAGQRNLQAVVGDVHLQRRQSRSGWRRFQQGFHIAQRGSVAEIDGPRVDSVRNLNAAFGDAEPRRSNRPGKC